MLTELLTPKRLWIYCKLRLRYWRAKRKFAMPWFIHSIRRIYQPSCFAQVDGAMYAYAVAEPYTAGRLKAAWWVLTGKAYAFEWPKAGDLEAAIGLPLWDRSKFNPGGTQLRT